MAGNAIYPLWKEALISGAADSTLEGGNVKVALVDAGVYTYSALDEFYDDLSGVLGTPQTLLSVTYTTGTLDADNVAFTTVSGGDVSAIVFYIDTGTPATSRLVSYHDTGVTGLPVTANGGDISLSITDIWTI